MIAPGMVGWRNPARYLAPLAIAAVAAAAYMIIHHAVIHKHTSSSTTIAAPATTVHTGRGHRVSTKAKFYVVRPNDTLSKIAAKTGVSISTLEALNKNVNPDALHPQQRLRLRR
jgi:LysM repeat protein